MYKSASYEPSPKIQNASVSDQARKKLTMKKVKLHFVSKIMKKR
jgi:hypothetical protein